MRRLHAALLITGLPLGILQWTSILLWIVAGIWWLFVIYAVAAVPYAVWVTKFYFKRVAYLTCTCCGHKGFCVETYGEEINKER